MLDNLQDTSLPGFDNNFISFYPTETSEETDARKIRYYAKIASKYGADRVIVGDILETWEDYTENRLYATVSYPVQDAEFTGTRKVICFIGLSSPLEVAQLGRCYYSERTLVIDHASMQIIAAHPAIF